MTKGIKTGLASALVGVVGIGSAVSRAEWSGTRGPSAAPGYGMRRARIQQLVRQLELDEEQQLRVHAIMQSHREEFLAAMRPAVVAHAGVVKQFLADEIDEQAVREATRQSAGQFEEVAVVAARAVTEIRAVLTPEQRDKLLQHREKMFRRHAERLDIAREVIDTLKGE